MKRRKVPMWRKRQRNYVWTPDRWWKRYVATRRARDRGADGG